MFKKHLGRSSAQDECLGLQNSRALATSEVVSLECVSTAVRKAESADTYLRVTHARRLLHFLCLCPLRWVSAHEALAYVMTFLTSNDPLAHAHVLGCVSDTSSTAAYNEISRSVCWVRAHTLNNAAVDNGIRGYVAGLAFRQGPSDCFPRPILLQVHTSEGQVFHYVPRYDTHAIGAVVELQDIMDTAFGRSGVEVFVKGRIGVFAMMRKNIIIVRITRCIDRRYTRIGDDG
jgi:hypothetical protein